LIRFIERRVKIKEIYPMNTIPISQTKSSNFEELNWPHSITARPGEHAEPEEGESWPHEITARPGEAPETTEESNWPENITTPSGEFDQTVIERDWPHNITARPEE
jgi:hypothetical protein